MRNWLSYSSPLLSPLNIGDDNAKAERCTLLIDGVQSFIERFCHRQFALREHDETYFIAQDGSIILDNFPVESISRFAFFNTGFCVIKNTTAQVATVGTDETGVNLMAITNGVVVKTALPYASYVTLEAMGAAINAVSGFVAVVDPSKENLPSADLVRGQWGNCALSGVNLAQWQDETISFDFDRKKGIIWAVLPLGLASGYATPTAIPLNMYRDFKARVIYQAGYKTIPHDLQLCAANLVMNAYNGLKEVQSENLGGQWSYTYLSPERLTMGEKQILSRYKDRRC